MGNRSVVGWILGVVFIIWFVIMLIAFGLAFLAIPYLLTLVLRKIGYDFYRGWKGLLISGVVAGAIWLAAPAFWMKWLNTNLLIAYRIAKYLLDAGFDFRLGATNAWTYFTWVWQKWLIMTIWGDVVLTPFFAGTVLPVLRRIGSGLIHYRLSDARDLVYDPPAATVRTAVNRKRLRTSKFRAKNGVPLGLDAYGNIISLSDHALNHHALLLGGTGTGKTTLLLSMLSDVAHRQPVIFLDMKGDPGVVAQLERLARHTGARFQVWGMDGPSRWNPLGHGNYTELADKITAMEHWEEPGSKAAAVRYLARLFKIVALAGETPTLRLVLKLFKTGDLLQYAADHKIPADELKDLENYVQGLNQVPADVQSISGLAARLAVLAESEPGRWLEGADIDIIETIQNNGIILFSLQSMKYPEMAAKIGSLVLQDLINIAAVTQQEAPQHPGRYVYVVVDDFSALSGDNVRSLLQRGRSARYNIILSTQEAADLDKIDPTLKEVVLTNCTTKIFGRQESPAECSQLAGFGSLQPRTFQYLARGTFVVMGAFYRTARRIQVVPPWQGALGPVDRPKPQNRLWGFMGRLGKRLRLPA